MDYIDVFGVQMKAFEDDGANFNKTRKNELIRSPGFILVCVGTFLLLITLSLPLLDSHGVRLSTHSDQETIIRTKMGYDFPLVYAGIVISIFTLISFLFIPNLKTVIAAIVLYCACIFFSLLYFVRLLSRDSAFWYELRIGAFVFVLASIGGLVGSILFVIRYLKYRNKSTNS